MTSSTGATRLRGKGNIGPQNYEIPPEVDLDRYSTVVIWFVRFSVAFGAVELMAT